jgi:hypothetical protein
MPNALPSTDVVGTLNSAPIRYSEIAPTTSGSGTNSAAIPYKIYYTFDSTEIRFLLAVNTISILCILHSL